MEFTKGKWKVREYRATVFNGQASLGCYEVWAGERRIASSINEDNAQLIATAPKLYKALKDLDFQLLGANISFSQDMLNAKKNARQALAEAEGK